MNIIPGRVCYFEGNFVTFLRVVLFLPESCRFLMTAYFKQLSCLFYYCPQIKADMSTKNGQIYFVKWVGINNMGCTWERKAHFVGTVVEAKF